MRQVRRFRQKPKGHLSDKPSTWPSATFPVKTNLPSPPQN